MESCDAIMNREHSMKISHCCGILSDKFPPPLCSLRGSNLMEDLDMDDTSRVCR